jgi:hypothetical protein
MKRLERKILERKILEALAMHAKKLRECRGKGIKPGRGNEKTSRSLLQKASLAVVESFGSRVFRGVG